MFEDVPSIVHPNIDVTPAFYKSYFPNTSREINLIGS